MAQSVISADRGEVADKSGGVMLLGQGGRARLAASLGFSAVLLPVLLVAHAGGGLAMAGAGPIDFDLFGPAGAALVEGRWGEVYADPAVQAGPVELLPYGIAYVLGAGVLEWTIASLLTGWLTTVALGFLVVTVAPRARGRRTQVLTLAALGAGVLLGPLALVLLSGHPAQVVVPLMWVAAAVLVVRHRSLPAALLIGLSAAWEPWGLLGAPILLLAARPTLIRLMRDVAVATIAACAFYAPFVFSGTFAMLGFGWRSHASPTLVAGLLGGADVGWGFRVLQGTVTVGAVALLAWLLRGRADAAWIVPLGVLALRLVADPLAQSYYTLAPVTMLVLATAVLARNGKYASAAVALAAAVLIRVLPLSWMTEVGLLAVVLLFAGGARVSDAGKRLWHGIASRVRRDRIQRQPSGGN